MNKFRLRFLLLFFLIASIGNTESKKRRISSAQQSVQKKVTAAQKTTPVRRKKKKRLGTKPATPLQESPTKKKYEAPPLKRRKRRIQESSKKLSVQVATKKQKKRSRLRPTNLVPAKLSKPMTKLVHLREAIDSLARESDKDTSIGLKIVLLKNNKVLYQKNPQVGFKPASSTKLITAAAAYHILGPEYRFKTTISTDEQPTPTSINNLYIKGAGDPTLSENDLSTLVATIKSLGIEEIRGDIIVDTSLISGPGRGPGWRSDDGAVFYKAPSGALMINHNCMRIRVKPSRMVGKQPVVTLFPHTPFSIIRNEARTKEEGKGKTLHVLRGENNSVIVKGTVPRLSKPKFYRFAIEEPDRYAGEVLAGIAKEHNLSFSGRVRMGPVPQDALHLATHTSDDLNTLIRRMLKSSDNLYADALFRVMGAYEYGVPGTWETGRRAVTTFLEETVGIDTKKLKVFDGSGLSHDNQISPDHFIQLLHWMYCSSLNKENFIAALPIGGVDGTLRNRTKLWSTKAAVQAKTGLIAGVSSLTGYITPRNGLPLIFVVMVNRKHASAVSFKHNLEDQLGKLLATHAFTAS